MNNFFMIICCKQIKKTIAKLKLLLYIIVFPSNFVAMQQTPEFANEILRALRGRSEWKVDITKNELRDYWHRMAGSVDSRIQLFFYM